MAIAIQPRFPTPDRTKQSIRFKKDQDAVIDIGWCEGALSDGRVFRAEMWAQDQISMLTVFFSSIGLEDLDDKAMKRFIEREEVVTFKSDCPSYCSTAMLTDDGGNRVCSVNIVIGDEDQSYIDNSVPIFPYSRIGEPNTVFNPIPIRAARSMPDPNARSRFVWQDGDITLYSPEDARKAFPEAFADDAQAPNSPDDSEKP